MTKDEEVAISVDVFIGDWLDFAKGNTGKCPIPYMNKTDIQYYCKRILLRDKKVKEIPNIADLSVRRICQYKCFVIRNEFEDLYRMTHNLPRKMINMNAKTIK